MRITPLDIRKQEFRKAMRGLDAEEVYAFLTTVADEYEAVLNDNKALRERLLELDDKVQEYRNMEKTLRNTLLTAERVNAEAKENARREAGLIIKEAEIQAEKALRNIRSEELALRNSIKELKHQKEAYLSRIKMLAEAHLKFVESAERDFAEDDRMIESMVYQKEAEVETAKPEPRAETTSGTRSSAEEFAEINEKAGESPGSQKVSGEHAEDQFQSKESPKAQAALSDEALSGGAQNKKEDAKINPAVPDLNEILERMAETQKQALHPQGSDKVQPGGGAPAESRSQTEADRRPGPGREAPGMEESSEIGEQQVAQGETIVSGEQRETSVTNIPERTPEEEARKGSDPVSPGAGVEDPGEKEQPRAGASNGSDEWSLDRLKRDILSSASGENEKS